MPQMMPINWMLSFIFFLLVFFIFNIMNYYIYNVNKIENKKNNLNIKMKNFSWKW
uniref:ATP synthase F0 subunit 8 n=1 Tax=Westermannia superba TaxID=1232061 RepID=UPI0021CC58FE|nr:ATP synthase F0 subunit 8 [Westermannia superba]UWM92712.1 ATP synthase F0 subunit 8 [Westermannia superba]